MQVCCPKCGERKDARWNSKKRLSEVLLSLYQRILRCSYWENEFEALSNAQLSNYPSFYKLKLKEGGKLRWKGNNIIIPKVFNYDLGSIFILLGQYSIPECDIKKDDIVFDIGAHFGFFSYFALQRGGEKSLPLSLIHMFSKS
jgi:hypothetical protein